MKHFLRLALLSVAALGLFAVLSPARAQGYYPRYGYCPPGVGFVAPVPVYSSYYAAPRYSFYAPVYGAPAYYGPRYSPGLYSAPSYYTPGYYTPGYVSPSYGMYGGYRRY